MDTKLDLEMITFKSQDLFRKWLHENHSLSPGIWLRLYKKTSGVDSINYAQALDEALCYGWIDGQSKKYDEVSFLQRFTPRRSKSIWSKRNTQYIERLSKAGKMMPSGYKVGCSL